MQNLIFRHTLSCFFFSSSIEAQNIKGKVIDDAGEPLISASVVEKGTSNGTVTDINGAFSLNVSKIPVTLEISYTGYTSKTIEVTNSDENITVSLSEGLGLNEVVVVGSRGKPRTILESAVPIDNINAGELVKSGQSTVDQMIN